MGIAAESPYIKMTDCHNTVMFTHCPFVPPSRPRYRRINEWFYFVPSTGEIREFEPKSETKGDNLDSVRRSFGRLKAIINCNYETPSQIRYVTLTYAVNMQDNSRIKSDMQKFNRNLKRRFGTYEYIYVKEKQGRGAWHMHMVLFFPSPAPYMPNEDVAACWKHGFVNVQGFRDDINNLGNYLCAYLTDDKETSKKGARLANYESGIHLYCCSKGIKRPVEGSCSYHDYLRIASGGDCLKLSEKAVNRLFASGDMRTVKRELFAVV